MAIDYYRKFKNVRYIEVYDAEKVGIKNSTRCGNIGAKRAKGDILIVMVDCCRIPTPGSIMKTKIMFEARGLNICTTIPPYHIGTHYSDRNFTPEECRKVMKDLNWREDPYRLFKVAAYTRISKTGIIDESTFMGISKENFIKIRGWNESFKDWDRYNLDLWRRCTRVLPEGGINNQKVNSSGRWGKVGLGLEVVNIDSEGTFHQHHDIFVPRNHSNFKRDNEKVWLQYENLGECVIANIENPNWGEGDIEEIDLGGLL